MRLRPANSFEWALTRGADMRVIRNLAASIGILWFVGCTTTNVHETPLPAPPSLHRLTLEELFSVRLVSRLDLSPDGAHVLIATQGKSLEKNEPTSELFLASTEQTDGDLLVLPPEAAHATWQPDSHGLTFLKTTPGCIQVWHIPVGTRKPVAQRHTCLEPRGREFTSYGLSPSGRFLAYLAQEPAHDAVQSFIKRVTSLAQQQREPPGHCIHLDSDQARKNLDALDRACTGTSVGAAWMANGYEVATPAYRAANAVQSKLPPAELWVLDMATGEMHRVSDPKLDVHVAAWSMQGQLGWLSLERDDALDNKDRVYQTGSGSWVSFGGTGYISWLDPTENGASAQTVTINHLDPKDLIDLHFRWSPSGDQVAFAPSWGQPGNIQVIRAVSNSVARVVPVPGVLHDFDWGADGLYVLDSDRQTQKLLRVDPENIQQSVELATSDTRWHDTPSFSADRSHYVVTLQDVAEPTRVFEGATGSTQLREIVGFKQLNPQWTSVAPFERGRVDWRSSDKYDFYGMTLALRDADPKVIRPTVVALLGAGATPQLKFDFGDDQQNLLLLAAAGNEVFIPTDRSRASDSTPKGYRGLGDLRTYYSGPWSDVMDGVDALVKQGLADENQLFLMGFSYGGGLAGFGITQTQRFKACVLKEPVTLSLAEMWQAVWGQKGYGDVFGPNYGIDNPFEGKGLEFVQAQSALTYVNRVRTPTLLEFGAKSGNAQIGGNAFLQGLRSFGVESDLIIYPRMIHGWSEPLELKDALERDQQWFARHGAAH